MIRPSPQLTGSPSCSEAWLDIFRFCSIRDLGAAEIASARGDRSGRSCPRARTSHRVDRAGCAQRRRDMKRRPKGEASGLLRRTEQFGSVRAVRDTVWGTCNAWGTGLSPLSRKEIVDILCGLWASTKRTYTILFQQWDCGQQEGKCGHYAVPTKRCEHRKLNASGAEASQRYLFHWLVVLLPLSCLMFLGGALVDQKA